jgi:sorting nexin-25
VELLSQERVLAELIALIRDNLFPVAGNPPGEVVGRSSGEEGDLAWRALGQLLSYPPELLVTALGEDRYRGGVVTLFEFLQCHALNKQLLYTLLDVIVTELFPELNHTTEQHSDEHHGN